MYELYNFYNILYWVIFEKKLNMNILIINGWHPFSGSQGRFNKSLSEISFNHFKSKQNHTVWFTQISEEIDFNNEINKWINADLIVFHTPIWWFGLPHGFKQYLDNVLALGYKNGIWEDDGRKPENPEINYGTGGLLSSKYLLTTSWNAPRGAFELEGELFNQQNPDTSVLSGFHAMTRYLGMGKIDSLKFFDIEKNANPILELNNYENYLQTNF